MDKTHDIGQKMRQPDSCQNEFYTFSGGIIRNMKLAREGVLLIVTSIYVYEFATFQTSFMIFTYLYVVIQR